MRKAAPLNKHPSLEHADAIFDSELLCSLINAWDKVSTPASHTDLSQDKGGSIEELQDRSVQKQPRSVRVRRVGDRWEAFGHYKDDNPPIGRYISTPGTSM